MQVHKTNYQVNTTPKFQVLTEDQIEAIYYAALRVLYETGVRVYDKEGVEIVYSGGAIVEDTVADSSLVKIPHYVIEKARTTVPSKVGLAGPDRKYRMELYKNQIYFGGGSDTPFTLDPYTGKRRRTTYQDYTWSVIDLKRQLKKAKTIPNMINILAWVQPLTKLEQNEAIAIIDSMANDLIEGEQDLATLDTF